MMDVFHEATVGIPWQNIKTIYIDFPWHFESHWHLEYEIIYVKKGRQRIMLDKTLVKIKEGEVLIVSPGEMHSYLDEEGKSEIMIIVFEQIILQNLGLSAQEKETFLNFLNKTQISANKCSAGIKKILDDLCMAIHKERREQEIGYIIWLHAYVYQFFMTVFRNFQFRDLQILGDGRFRRKYTKLAPLLNYLAANYAQDITLDDAAGICHFSRYYFCKLFKEVTGSTFINYLNGVRVSKAQRELLNTRKCMIQIAMDTGFNSVDSFNKAFKQFCNCTPSEYRKQFGDAL